MPSGRERADDGRVIAVGLELVAVRGRAGRVWRVARELHAGMWLLVPLGADVRPATVGVRSISRTTDELRDAQRWAVYERFPAPREKDCAYGCCRAGDVGLYSEVVPAPTVTVWPAGELVVIGPEARAEVAGPPVAEAVTGVAEGEAVSIDLGLGLAARAVEQPSD